MNIYPIEQYKSYLEDESRLTGFADGLFFPESEQELAEALSICKERGLDFTLQGARTGLCGGAVPRDGLAVCLELMNGIGDVFEQDGKLLMQVQAGAQLGEIEKRARAAGLFFPPNPTEKSATIGGMFATGGGGSSGLYYGASSKYVEALTWVSADGEKWEIRRGDSIFDGEGFTLPNGKRLEVSHSHGIDVGTDAIDYFAGTEGRLGAAAGFTLSLLPLPEHIWGVVFFHRSQSGADAFIKSLRKLRGAEGARLVCAEYYDSGALRLLREEREKNSLLKGLTEFPAGARSAVYIELASDEEDALDEALGESLDMFAKSGGSDEDSWAESGFSGISRFRDMRHALPEIVGARTGVPGGTRTRLETDFAAPPEKTLQYLQMYRDGTERIGVNCAVYGHVLQNRLHAALMYETEEQFAAATELTRQWARRVVQDGGLPVSENGYGKLKAELLENT